MILRELAISSSKMSHKLYLLLETINEAMVNEVNAGRYDNMRREELEAENMFLFQLSNLSTRLGFANPRNKAYFKPEAIEHIPQVLSYLLYQLVIFF